MVVLKSGGLRARGFFCSSLFALLSAVCWYMLCSIKSAVKKPSDSHFGVQFATLRKFVVKLRDFSFNFNIIVSSSKRKSTITVSRRTHSRWPKRSLKD